MTGTFAFDRQMSSTDGTSNVDKSKRPILRRSSSAVEPNRLEPILDLSVWKEKLANKVDTNTNDIDSGTEDSEVVENPLIDAPTTAQNDESDQLGQFSACEDDGYAESRGVTPTNDLTTNEIEPNLDYIRELIELASRIPHELKKTFCQDTSIVFHAEYARLISCPLALTYPNISYIFCAIEELPDGYFQQIGFIYPIALNAKAQFQCTHCKRLWTSMRARCLFHITEPRQKGWIVLEILGQSCQVCNSSAEALWYPEEVCRVMHELSHILFSLYFHTLLPTLENNFNNEQAPAVPRSNRSIHYDPKQRKGKMSAPHDSSRCTACKFGICYPP